MKIKFLAYLNSLNQDPTELKIDYSGLSLNEKKDGLIYDKRESLEGTIKIFGTDYYNVINSSLRIIPYKCYSDGVLIGSGTFDKLQYNDSFLKIIKLKLVNVDKYFEFDKNSDTKYNVCGVTSIYNKSPFQVLYLQDKTEYVAFGASFSKNAESSLLLTPRNIALTVYLPTWNPLNSFDNFVNEVETSAYSIVNAYKPNDGWSYYYLEVESFKLSGLYEWRILFYANSGYGNYDGTTAIPPDSGNWFYQEDEIINGVTVPVFVQPLPETSFTKSTSIVGNTNLTNNYVLTYGSGSTNFYRYARRFDETLQFIVNKINPDILFDFTKWKFINNFTGNDVSHSYLDGTGGLPTLPAYVGNKPLKDLLILPLSEAIPQSDGTEQSNRAITALLNFNDLMKFFEDRGFLWYIDADNYFILEHYSELSQTTQSLNITNRLTQKIFEYKDAPYFKIHNTDLAIGLDMKGVDTIINNVNSTETYNSGQNIIFTDIGDIRNRKEEAYSNLNNELFVMVCTDFDAENYTYYLRDDIGLLSNVRKNNSNLGFAYGQRYFFAPFPNESINVNGIEITAENNKVRRNKTIKLEIPYLNIDFSKNILIFGENFEIINRKTKLNSYKSVIELEA